MVVGAGLAGTAIAWRLARHGWETTLIERHPHPAQEASGNRAAALSPMVSRDDSLSSRLSRACFFHLLREIHGLSRLGFPVQWSDRGVLQLAKKPDKDARERLSIQNAEPENHRPGCRVTDILSVHCVGGYSKQAIETNSSTRRRPSSPPKLPSLKWLRGIGSHLSREKSLNSGCGSPVSEGSYCPVFPPSL